MIEVVTGPTGSGKTDYALKLSQESGRQLFNADPFQFYRGLEILSNQPQNASAIRYTGFRDLSEPLNAGSFGRLVGKDLQADGIWVGVGLYMGAVLYGLHEDGRKGTPFQDSPRVEFRMTVLSPPRDILYERLNERVDAMMNAGALEEAQKILERVRAGEISFELPTLKAIGLSHLLKFLKGELGEADAISLWKRDTRHLAKRQWTWLRKFCPPGERIYWIF